MSFLSLNPNSPMGGGGGGGLCRSVKKLLNVLAEFKILILEPSAQPFLCSYQNTTSLAIATFAVVLYFASPWKAAMERSQFSQNYNNNNK